MKSPFKKIGHVFQPNYSGNFSNQKPDGSILLTLTDTAGVAVKRFISSTQWRGQHQLERLITSLQLSLAIERGEPSDVRHLTQLHAMLRLPFSGQSLHPPVQRLHNTNAIAHEAPTGLAALSPAAAPSAGAARPQSQPRGFARGTAWVRRASPSLVLMRRAWVLTVCSVMNRC